MTRGYVILMFLIAAVAICSHQQAMAKNIATYSQSHFSATTSCSNSDKGKIKKCMTQTVSIDKCCPLFKRTIGANCKCYNYAEDLDNQALITLQSYCDINNPCKSVQKVVADGSRTDTVEAVATISASPSSRLRPQAKLKCSAADKAKVKTCMTKTSSIDACCPTFRSILGKSCPCYNYAMKLDNQALITLEAYCDVNNPCNKVQVI
ncbi:hypothetical protein MTR67_024798 [Solanum verrucosum]|uniref:Uncharacterized protein n=1 Tax=Solanum verrucosum TaxID=315347 RepID=A0AAF0QZL3_SOLVR|nr:uncharacterized protein LOC125831584 [Solanum verrucosum]WMV31413.1 hypothetical protein MTR67_024798 [Solanum verrucosum]